jgi:hypothetical protein
LKSAKFYITAAIKIERVMVVATKFTSDFLDKVNLRSPKEVLNLVVKYLCGESCIPKLHTEETKLISAWLESAAKNKTVNYNQLNELLLLLNQDTVGEDFFKFFFEQKEVSLEQLRQGIVNFCGLAMLCFGNFRYANKLLSHKTITEIAKELFPYSKTEIELVQSFKNRPNKMVEISKISKDKTWLVGELLPSKIDNEAKFLKKEMQKARKKKSKFSEKEIDLCANRLFEIETELKEIQEIARRNTDVYLTWDYMDVYFATSMRADWEFRETYDFIEEVFDDPRLKELNLRYFDPTQSKCGNPRDKGLIEGLMLNKALCTIYMVQETDTLGKDSELAATLAQKKPVIAYVPEYDAQEYSKKISTNSLEYFKKRILILMAEEIFDDPDCEKLLANYPNYNALISNFLKKIDRFYHTRLSRFLVEKEQSLKKGQVFEDLCSVLAIAECFRFDKRAKTLSESHPLGMQIDLHSGVSNGVLVVRNSRQCSDLLRKLLTNNAEFSISHEAYKDESRKSREGYLKLVEVSTGSTFRVITDQEKLTNSFWDFFLKRL